MTEYLTRITLFFQQKRDETQKSTEQAFSHRVIALHGAFSCTLSLKKKELVTSDQLAINQGNFIFCLHGNEESDKLDEKKLPCQGANRISAADAQLAGNTPHLQCGAIRRKKQPFHAIDIVFTSCSCVSFLSRTGRTRRKKITEIALKYV